MISTLYDLVGASWETQQEFEERFNALSSQDQMELKIGCATFKRTKLLVSFGMRFGKPRNSTVIDVRTVFNRNPHRLLGLRYKRGTDADVAHDVEQTPGFEESYAKLKFRVLLSTQYVVYIGCTSGHHRSVYLTERLGRELGVPIHHRDFYRE